MEALARELRSVRHLRGTATMEGKDEYITKCLKDLAMKPPNRVIPIKDYSAAARHYKAAEAKMRDRQYREALVLYTKAIQNAHAYCTLAGQSYSGRSCALAKLEFVKEALVDVVQALELPLSPQQNAQCKHSKEVIEATLRIRNISVDNANGERDNDLDLALSYGESDEFPGASSAIKIAYDKQYGRKFVATRAIKAGDVLLIQRPYATGRLELTPDDYHPAPGKIGWICDHCFGGTMAPICCDTCFKLYCSKECRAEAYEEYHKTECLIILPATPCRTILRLLLKITKQGAELDTVKKCMEEMKKSKDLREKGFTDKKFRGDSYQAVLSLHNKIADWADELIDEAGTIVMKLRNETNFCRGDNDALGLMKLTCYLYDTFITCGRRVYEHGTMAVVGEALYPVFSLLNHSCTSNTIAYNYKKTYCVLRAAEDIKAGEQIFINYLYPEGFGLQFEDRREHLLTGWNIRCLCKACARKYNFTSELHRKLNVPATIQNRLRANIMNTETMWDFLNIIHKEISRPCFEIEVMKQSLCMVYMGMKFDVIWQMYNALGAI